MYVLFSAMTWQNAFYSVDAPTCEVLSTIVLSRLFDGLKEIVLYSAFPIGELLQRKFKRDSLFLLQARRSIQELFRGEPWKNLLHM